MIALRGVNASRRKAGKSIRPVSIFHGARPGDSIKVLANGRVLALNVVGIATEVLTGAGFSRVRRAAEGPFNMVLEARP